MKWRWPGFNFPNNDNEDEDLNINMFVVTCLFLILSQSDLSISLPSRKPGESCISAQQCSNSSDNPSKVIHSPPESHQLLQLRLLSPSPRRLSSAMLEHMRCKNTRLSPIHAFILEQALYLPLQRPIDARFHIRKRNGCYAEDAKSCCNVQIPLQGCLGCAREEDVCCRAGSDYRRYPDGS